MPILEVGRRVSGPDRDLPGDVVLYQHVPSGSLSVVSRDRKSVQYIPLVYILSVFEVFRIEQRVPDTDFEGSQFESDILDQCQSFCGFSYDLKLTVLHPGLHSEPGTYVIVSVHQDVSLDPCAKLIEIGTIGLYGSFHVLLAVL